MSEQKWKPGDVAMLTYREGGNEVGFCYRAGIVGGKMSSQAAWHVVEGEVWSSVIAARPLVVIDPEDRERVERLARGWHNEREFAIPWDKLSPRGRDESFRTLQAALREFASPTPPKPNEPLGLGAVVEDAEGGRWIKIDDHSDCNDWVDLGAHEWQPLDGERETVRHHYRNITAVRVLSEGVQ